MLSYLEWVTRSLEHADNHQISGGVVAEIQNFIRQHYQENISLNMLAEQFYMHPNYLSRLFKEKQEKFCGLSGSDSNAEGQRTFKEFGL